MTAAPTPTLLPIDEVNRLPLDAFTEALRPLFEAAGPLGERVAAGRPFASYAALLAYADSTVETLGPDEQVTVVNAHPRIGESAAVVKETSALSYREQGYDAEASIPRAELEQTYAELARLNAEYEAKYGFRFVVFVNGRSKAAILAVLKERITRPREEELPLALHEMLAIARDRLKKLQASA
ncbi:MAG: 2-oxo-4-hydroxy-4-carboxy-5-ureidoimidazoline decarboxylase [Chloroflexi bacterium]|nr:2-oxo-4-hydroxy-4-carboxy-5-ureidoimidazoline decarboxylase [Chloroflexota bacterium]